MEESVVRQLSPLSLAFVGDAVFDLIVRTTCVMDGNRPVDKLNRDKVRIVNAAAQAALAERIEPLLTEEERAVMRRGKNAKIHSAAKTRRLPITIRQRVWRRCAVICICSVKTDGFRN